MKEFSASANLRLLSSTRFTLLWLVY